MQGWNVNRTGSGSCPVVDFGIGVLHVLLSATGVPIYVNFVLLPPCVLHVPFISSSLIDSP
jgi:hypothetical protein